MANNGFVMFKFFFIFSYPFEEKRDFALFEEMIQRLKNKMINLKRPIFLRIKFTPFIPNLLTPLEDFTPHYDIDMREKIDMFFLRCKMHLSNIVVINDGMLEPFSYYTQTYLSRCCYEDIDMKLLLDKKTFNFISEDKIKTLKPNNKILTHISLNVRNKAKEKIYKKIEDLGRCIK